MRVNPIEISSKFWYKKTNNMFHDTVYLSYLSAIIFVKFHFSIKFIRSKPTYKITQTKTIQLVGYGVRKVLKNTDTFLLQENIRPCDRHRNNGYCIVSHAMHCTVTAVKSSDQTWHQCSIRVCMVIGTLTTVS